MASYSALHHGTVGFNSLIFTLQSIREHVPLFQLGFHDFVQEQRFDSENGYTPSSEDNMDLGCALRNGLWLFSGNGFV